MKILIFGDIVGRMGREAVIKALPDFRKQTTPDLILANCENLAGGRGVTREVLLELLDSGIDAFTSGNHLWDRPQLHEALADPRIAECLVRPANYPHNTPGKDRIWLTIGKKRVLVLNFTGRVFASSEAISNPFLALDSILGEERGADVVLIDFHAEATSEKAALGWYADGRASIVWGTHTHVPTRDERILPKGTAFITDVGMSGYNDGIIGVEREPILRHFTGQGERIYSNIPRSGKAVVNALTVNIDDGTGLATSLRHLQEIIPIH